MGGQREDQVGQGERRWVVRENIGGWSGRTQVGGQGEHRWVVREKTR